MADYEHCRDMIGQIRKRHMIWRHSQMNMLVSPVLHHRFGVDCSPVFPAGSRTWRTSRTSRAGYRNAEAQTTSTRPVEKVAWPRRVRFSSSVWYRYEQGKRSGLGSRPKCHTAVRRCPAPAVDRKCLLQASDYLPVSSLGVSCKCGLWCQLARPCHRAHE